MAQTITNLTASWLPSVGIQLSWDAASDVTTGSIYEVYVLQKVTSRTPKWVQIASGISNPVFSTASAKVILSLPAPAYFFPWSAMQNLFGIGSTVAPNSLAFSVIHTDKFEVSSTALSVSAVSPAPHRLYGVPHFQNGISLDAFGSFGVNPQDSFEEIAASVGMFLGTIPGQRTVVPEYGTPDLPMNEIDAGSIELALNTEETRAIATVSLVYDSNNNATLNVSIKGGGEENS